MNQQEREEFFEGMSPHMKHLIRQQWEDMRAGETPIHPVGEINIQVSSNRTGAPNTPLLGFGGLRRSGKDASSDHLVETQGFVKLGMSDVLARCLYVLNPLIPLHGQHIRYADIVDMVGYVEAKKIPEVRQLLQRLGTDVGRDILGEDIWVSALEKTIKEHRAAGTPVALTGVRFSNELEMIRRAGGTTVYIHRPSEASTDAESIATHKSEKGLRPEDFDHQIINDGSLSELYAQVDEVISRIFVR